MKINGRLVGSKYDDCTVKYLPNGGYIQKLNGGRISYHDKNGKFHREDGPAVLYSDGSQEWYVNGFRHRTDGGPAIIHADGTRGWYVNGKFHRTGGPAVIRANGYIQQEWYVNGNLHRSDGPAIVYADGSEYWYIDGLRK